MAETTLTKQVREALKNAKENGYSFDGWTDNDIACDLVAYDADLETQDIEALIQVIGQVRKEMGI